MSGRWRERPPWPQPSTKIAIPGQRSGLSLVLLDRAAAVRTPDAALALGA